MATFHALVLSLPTRDSTVRMRVWRALKESGCAVLRDGVYVLPSGAPRAAVLGRMESEVKSAGGFAMTAELEFAKDEHLAQLRKLFDRSEHYGELLEAVRKTRLALQHLGPRKGQTAIQRLERSFDRLAQIDFFPGHGKLQAADALSGLKRDLLEVCFGEPRPSGRQVQSANRAKYQRRVWATRKDPWVDRLASAWLIKRFIDHDARFVWIDRPRDRPRKAIGFDFDGAEFTHANNRVTFEVLLASFGLGSDLALAKIGSAVHFLDVGGIPVPDARGFETVLRGIKEKARSDHALLAESMQILDLFYSVYAQAPDRPSAQ